MAKNDDPKRESELDDFRRALTQQSGIQAPMAQQEPSAWERITAGLRDAADRSTGWASDRVRDTFGEAVSRFFGLPEKLHSADRQPEPEPEKGIDR